MSDVVADRFIEAEVDFADFSNVQVLSDYDKHPIAESEEKHTGLNSDPGETALDPGETVHPEESQSLNTRLRLADCKLCENMIGSPK